MIKDNILLLYFIIFGYIMLLYEIVKFALNLGEYKNEDKDATTENKKSR